MDDEPLLAAANEEPSFADDADAAADDETESELANDDALAPLACLSLNPWFCPTPKLPAEASALLCECSRDPIAKWSDENPSWWLSYCPDELSVKDACWP